MTMNDALPVWLTLKEAAIEVLRWLYPQPDRSLHHVRLLCELAELPDYLREGLLRPRWQRNANP
jgi:hypothetical protein